MSTPTDSTATLTRCPNCGQVPEWRESNDRTYPVLLVHDSRTCPGAFHVTVFHHTRQKAAARWTAMNSIGRA